MLNYLLESSVCLICLYLFYWLVLSREKFLFLNRAFLLFSVIVSLALPLVKVNISADMPLAVQALYDSAAITEVVPTNIDTGSNSLDWLSLIYWLGFLISLAILVAKIRNIRLRISRSHKERSGQLVLVDTDSQQTYSFFNYVFINKELREGQLAASIIEHERAHAKGLHSLDVILIELVKTLFWFNPIIHAYLKSLKLQHEYIADAHVTQLQGGSYEHTLIKHALVIQGIPLSSAYAQPPINKRLKMINENKTNPMKKLKLITAIPLLAVLFIAISCTENSETPPVEAVANSQSTTENLKEISGKVTESISGLGMNGVTVKGIPSGMETETDEHGKYMFNLVKSDTVLQFSKDDYSGYVMIGEKKYSEVNVSFRETLNE